MRVIDFVLADASVGSRLFKEPLIEVLANNLLLRTEAGNTMLVRRSNSGGDMRANMRLEAENASMNKIISIHHSIAII